MSFFDLFFPRRCLSCGQWGEYFCPDCLAFIKPPKRPICPQCFEGSVLGSTHARCIKPLSLDGLVSIARYEGIVKKAIKKLKYRFVTDLAEEFIASMKHIIEAGEDANFPRFDSSWTLVPVPLHLRRKKQRGFNQTQILGKILAKKMGWQYEGDLLKRRRYTKAQTEVRDKKKRRANIRWAFEISPGSRFSFPGSRIILFDDVWTTGSTIKECVQVLKRKKARKVWGLVLAR